MDQMVLSKGSKFFTYKNLKLYVELKSAQVKLGCTLTEKGLMILDESELASQFIVCDVRESKSKTKGTIRFKLLSLTRGRA